MKIFLFSLLLSSAVLAAPADLDRADQLLHKGLPAESRKIAEQELASDPKSLRARVVLAKSALAQQDLPSAHRCAEEVLKADPKNADYNALMGTVLVLEQQAPEAIGYLETALTQGAQEKKSPEAMALYSETLVTALQQAGQGPAALKRCLEFIQLYPQDANLYLAASRLYRERNDYQQALETAQKGLEVAPKFYNLYASLALAEAGLGHKDLSEKAFQQLLKYDPELAKVVRRVLDGTRKDSAELQLEVK
ncbi:tetratricopeptide repeat protein [bacterium]|nr:tetratricopeptide repeat protein [bacterium]